MKLGTLVRGEGKIYLELIAPDIEIDSLLISSQLEDESELPTAILADKDIPGRFIVVLPIVKANQSLKIELIDPSSRAVSETLEKRISPLATAITSKANSIRKKEDAARIRNMDERECIGEAHIVVERVVNIEERPELDVLRAAVSAIVLQRDASTTPLQVTLYDPFGKEQPISNLVVFSDEVTEISEDRAIRRVEFSLQKPASWEYFISVQAGSLRESSGFLWVDDRIMRRVFQHHGGDFDSSGNGNGYHDWFMNHHKTSAHILEMQRNYRFEANPRFSIIVPLFNTPIPFFKDMVNSVLSQTYGNFELILINASPDDEKLVSIVEDYQSRDERIVVRTLTENLGITLNTNEGIKIARGDFLCFFDHDDTLEPDILFEYAKGINKYPQTDMLYCDEDKLQEGRYVGGILKPDFDPVLLMSNNYICHMLAIRRDIFDSMNALPGKEFDGSQDHNLAILAGEKARNVYHARKVLYHWRVHAGSTASSNDAKPWTLESGRLAVEQHLQRIEARAQASNYPGFPNCYMVDYNIQEIGLSASIIITARSEGELSKRLESIKLIEGLEDCDISVIWAEGASTGQPSDRLSNAPAIAAYHQKPGEAITAALNKAAAQSAKDFLIFMDQDTEPLTPDFFNLLTGLSTYQNIAAVGPKTLYPDELVHNNGIVLSHGIPARYLEYSHKTAQRCFPIARFAKTVTALDKSCFLIKRSAFESVNGFDERFATDLCTVDLCIRLAKAGMSCAVEPRAEAKYWGKRQPLWHIEAIGTAGGDHRALTHEYGLLLANWPEVFSQPDPHYNINHKIQSANFELY